MDLIMLIGWTWFAPWNHPQWSTKAALYLPITCYNGYTTTTITTTAADTTTTTTMHYTLISWDVACKSQSL